MGNADSTASAHMPTPTIIKRSSSENIFNAGIKKARSSEMLAQAAAAYSPSPLAQRNARIVDRSLMHRCAQAVRSLRRVSQISPRSSASTNDDNDGDTVLLNSSTPMQSEVVDNASKYLADIQLTGLPGQVLTVKMPDRTPARITIPESMTPGRTHEAIIGLKGGSVRLQITVGYKL